MAVVVERVTYCRGCNLPHGTRMWQEGTIFNRFADECCPTCVSIRHMGDGENHPYACACGSTQFEARWTEYRNAWGDSFDVTEYADGDTVYAPSDERDSEYDYRDSIECVCYECGRAAHFDWSLD